MLPPNQTENDGVIQTSLFPRINTGLYHSVSFRIACAKLLIRIWRGNPWGFESPFRTNGRISASTSRTWSGRVLFSRPLTREACSLGQGDSAESLILERNLRNQAIALTVP